MVCFPRAPRRRPFLVAALVGLVFALSPLAAQPGEPIQDPLPNPVPSGLRVGVEPIKQIPGSGALNQMVPFPDGSGRWFVVAQSGRLFLLHGEDLAHTVYIDVRQYIGGLSSGRQRGLTYVALHPEFATNGRFYTVAEIPKGQATPTHPLGKPVINKDGSTVPSSHHSLVVEWTADDPTALEFSGTWREVMRVEQPYSDHNMGQLAFNPHAAPGEPDYGMLYIAVGDGGIDGWPVGEADRLDNAQDLSSPLGKMLRIDPDGTDGPGGGFGIPADNPFANDDSAATLGEVWAWGLRNPHRFSWDREDPDLMLSSDIGQGIIEEINALHAGGNYGWDMREGRFYFDENYERVLYPLPEDDAANGYVYPVTGYDHPEDVVNDRTGVEAAIAGGFVYRGSAIPELYGQYLFADFAGDLAYFYHAPAAWLKTGDWVQPYILTLYYDGRNRHPRQIVGSDSRTDVRFAEGPDGEIYFTSKRNSILYKLVRVPDHAEALWGAAAVYPNDWRYLPWFGWFNSEVMTGGSLYHERHGWLWTASAATDALTVYDHALGAWWSTSAQTYPALYLHGDNPRWLWFATGSSTPERQFYDFATAAWISESGLP